MYFRFILVLIVFTLLTNSTNSNNFSNNFSNISKNLNTIDTTISDTLTIDSCQFETVVDVYENVKFLDSLQHKSNYFKYHKVADQLQYIKDNYIYAKMLEDSFNIPMCITFAQAIHESGAGTSNLAKNANNHFGVKGYGKCKKFGKWRYFKNVEECYKHRGQFFKQNLSYMLEYDKNDYKLWCRKLGQCGYAGKNNFEYTKKLIETIEKYELNKLK